MTTQIIYASQPFGFDQTVLSGILLDARRCNNRSGVTGALVCRHDIYLQLLEGPEEHVRETYNRILRDDRHAGVKLYIDETVQGRLFSHWDMLHDPAQTWHWSVEQIAEGALERASKDDIRAVFIGLAAKTEKNALE